MYTSTIRRPLNLYVRYELMQSTHSHDNAGAGTGRHAKYFFLLFSPEVQPIGFADAMPGRARSPNWIHRERRTWRAGPRDVGVGAAVIGHTGRRRLHVVDRSGCTYAADASTQRIGMGRGRGSIAFLFIRDTPCWRR
jgi:hypothetical protein